ncbi:glycosyl hydrolase [Micromonospora sp. SL4-19]|uniref:glycosyl hydrolase n=1 Tax=Micromonospora sp. SL4-19 TaxID=3399129 RepID=UPI003A4E2C60
MTTPTSAFAERLESKFIDPDRIYSTDVRWWLGDASHTDETLLEEIQALYDGGFRGVELCMQNDSGAPDATYGYGSAMWTHKWNLVMNKLLDLGMGVYLTSGTNWSTSNVPGLDPTSQAAMQNLTLGTGTVNADQNLAVLPSPASGSRKAGATFVTAYAYKVVSGNTVDPNSFVNLAPMLTQGADVWNQNLNWTAPSGGQYRVFALWTQGTYQTSSPATLPSYATNYFDERGVGALREFWQQHYLSDTALVDKIKRGDVQLFMDSLEMSTGNGFTWWAQDMAQQFQARKGYDITPYLFLISGVGNVWNNPYHSVALAGTYKLDGAEDRRQRIVNDYQDVLTQLYRERMLQPLKRWLNSVGIKTRAQISYGQPLEISEPIMDVDYPEAENRNQYNQVDMFRYWTGGAKLENKVLSSETTALTFGANATLQLRLQDAYSQFAAGFQRTIWHIWTAGYGYGNYQWPGYSLGGSFALMAERFPGAENYDELNAHLGRVQQLMQTGKSRADVGFIQQKFVHGMAYGGGIGSNNQLMNWQLAHQGLQYRSTELQDNGYTYDYFSPRFLFDDDVYFDEKTKTIEKAGYKAVVLYQNWLDLDGAKRVRDWAEKGLKVVILGNAASQTPYNDGKDAELASVVAELKTLPTVRTATVSDSPADYFSSAAGGYHDNVMEKLQELGVYPYTGYSQPNEQLLTQTRQDAEGNRYVYVYNYDDGSYRDKSLRPEIRDAPNPGTNIKTRLVVDGQYIPYLIDAWTGRSTQLADYKWENGRTVVPIDLDYNNIALMAFEKVDSQKLHINSTNADSAHATPGGVAVRATHSGTVTTELSDGRHYQQDVTVPAPYDVTDWDLTVESWRPSNIAGDLVRIETIDGVTTTNRKTSTVKIPIRVGLDKLTTWNKIPEVGKAVSGTGHYEATFNWDASKATGAYLDFGDMLEESMEVWINGQKVGGRVSTNPTKVKKDVGGVGKPTINDGTGQEVPLVGKDQYTGGVSWMKPIADVSGYLVDGENEIVIDYNSALSNVQLDRGVARVTQNANGWWGYNIDYLDFGPKQAKIVPFVEMQYPGNDFAAVRWHIDQAEQAGELSGTALMQVRNHVDQAQKLADGHAAARAVIAQLDNAARTAAASPALVQALQALEATFR